MGGTAKRYTVLLARCNCVTAAEDRLRTDGFELAGEGVEPGLLLQSSLRDRAIQPGISDIELLCGKINSETGMDRG